MKLLSWLPAVATATSLIATSLVSAVPVASEKRAAPSIVKGKDYDRIVIIVFENQDYSDVAKDSYFSTIAGNHNGILLTNHMALTHPSQPNYVGMISGSTDGVFLDNDSNLDRKSVVDLLEAKGISWKSYQQGYPGNCSTGSSYGTYRRKHNPFISFENIAQNATRCANIVNADELDKDIENNTVPQFVFFTPDMNNDGHDTNLTYASDWAKSFLEPRVNKPAFSDNTLFIVTWDENKTWVIKKNQVYTILFGPAVKRSSKTDGNSYNHYSILKSVEENWSLGDLGEKDTDATPLVIKDQAENGASEKIKNVVLLMMENRSFDRMMGFFNYSNEIDNLIGKKEFNYVQPNDTSSTKVYATSNGLLKDPLDPPHGYEQVTYQITGNASMPSNVKLKHAPMSGFVGSFAKEFPDVANNVTALQQAVDAFDPSSIPITYELASNYTVIDRYFSSFPGSTMPNRMFAHSATSHGEVNTDGLKYIPGYPQRTIFHNLDDAGIEWRNYYQIVPSLLVFNKLRLSALDNYKNWATFKSDAKEGKLPPYSFIDPAYFSIPRCIPENDDHPPSDVAEGEKLIKEVYEALRASPQWKETLFIVTFDEHGGYFDHVPTPLEAPNPDNITDDNFNFDRLGVRVPMILISPWVEKGGVIHGAKGPYADSEYEHSSIPATIKKLFNLPNFLTKRDAWAGTFEHAISLDKPREDCPVTLSEPPAPAENNTNNKFEQEICNAFKKILQGES